jgi:HTH-like domain
VRRLLGEFKASERHVCELMAVPGSSGRYRRRRDDGLVQERLRELAREHPRFGYRRLHLYLHKEMGVNHKKVQRVYRELGLTVKRTRRKHLRWTLQPRPVLTAPNQEWALDFAGYVTAAGQRFRVLDVIDSFARQCLALEVATSFPQPARYPRARTGDRSPRKATIDSLRQRPGNDFAALPGVGHRMEDRSGPHSTGQADAERWHGEL